MAFPETMMMMMMMPTVPFTPWFAPSCSAPLVLLGLALLGRKVGHRRQPPGANHYPNITIKNEENYAKPMDFGWLFLDRNIAN